MGQKNILEIQTDLALPGNIKGGIDVYGNKQNGCYFSKDIDFDTDPFGIRAQIRPTVDVSQGTLATLNDTPKWFVKADASKIFCLTDANEVFQKSAGSWTRVNVSGQTGHGQGLVEYGDDLFYVQDSNVGMFDGAVWTDNWQTRSASENTYGPAIKFLGKFYVLSGRYVDSWDGVTWKQSDLTLPITEIGRSVAIWNGFLIIGCASGNVYLWDGTSETYNDVKMVPDGAAANVVKEFLNRLYVFAGRDSRIYEFDGANFTERARLPDIRESGFDLSSVSVWSGAVIGWQDKILFIVELTSVVNSLRTKSGVWSYTPGTDRLALEFTVSSGQTSTDFDVGALFFDEGSTTLYIGYEDSNAGSAGVYIDIVDSNSHDTDEGNYLITSELMPAEFALAFLRRFYVNSSKFTTPSTAKIIIAIRLDDDEETVLGSLTASTGSTFSIITTGTNIATVSVGDMLEVIAGPSARDVRFVSNVNNSASPKELTVSEQFSTTPVNNQTQFAIYRYQKVGEVSTDDALTLKSLEILRECKKAWVYIEIRGKANNTGERLTFKKGTLDYTQRPNC